MALYMTYFFSFDSISHLFSPVNLFFPSFCLSVFFEYGSMDLSRQQNVCSYN